MRLTRFYRIRRSAKSMMSYGLNTCNGNKRVVANRILTGKTGQPNLVRVYTSNTPVPKTWKISLGAHHHILTSSTIALARFEGVAEAPHPGRAADGMSSSNSISPWKRPIMAQIVCWKLMDIASRPLFHLVCGPAHEFACLVRESLVTTMDQPEICI